MDGDIDVHNGHLQGELSIGLSSSNDMNGDIDIDRNILSAGSVTIAGSLVGSLAVNNTYGALSVGSGVFGDITVADAIANDISIGGSVYGAASISAARVTSSGAVTVSGNLSGDIDIAGTLSGPIVIGGELLSTALVRASSVTSGNPISVYGDLSGVVTILGGASGPITVYENVTGGTISVGSMTSGTNSRIRVYKNHGGQIAVGGDMSQVIQVNYTAGSTSGSMDIDGNVDGDITVGGELSGNLSISGSLGTNGDVGVGPVGAGGEVSIGADVLGDVSVSGDLAGRMWVGADLPGHLRIDGSLKDNPNQACEVEVVGNITSTGAVAVDYDGWDLNDVWDPNAIVRVGEDDYTGNTPSEHIWEITGCKGDMNNDNVVNGDDKPAFDDALNDPGEYASDFPGLEGSMIWHGDMDCNNELNADDEGPLDYFIAEGCTNCTTECQYEACVADIDENGLVDESDLAILLADWGCTSDCVGDLDGDDDTDEADLAWLLAQWGNPCDCYPLRDGGGGEGFGGQGVRVFVQPYDTNGFSNDGFAGESDDFVFDLVIRVTDAGNDWTTSGVVARAENGATFRLAQGPTDPDQYASFVSAPRVVGDGPSPDNSGATVAGAYLPPDSDYDFATRIINVSWFDTVDSNDGPAAVMRLVIDVSAVPGADTSGGLGSVYFSQTGPALPTDIKVADLRSATGNRCDGGTLTGHDGEFFVKAD